MKQKLSVIVLVLFAIFISLHTEAQLGDLLKQKTKEVASGAKSGSKAEDWQLTKTFRDPYYMRGLFFLDDKTGWIAAHQGIFKTTDGGTTWEQQQAGGENFIIIYFLNSNDGFAAGEGTFWFTKDGGTNWAHNETFISQHGSERFSKMFFINTNIGYLVGDDIYKTVNAGKDWVRLNLPLPVGIDKDDLRVRDACFTDEKHIFVVGEKELLWTSEDGGLSFKLDKHEYFDGKKNNYIQIAFADTKKGYMIVAGEDLCVTMKTTDGGATWVKADVFKGMCMNTIHQKGNIGCAFNEGFMGNNLFYVTEDGFETVKLCSLPGKATSDAIHDVFVLSPAKAWAITGTYDEPFKLFSPKAK